MENQEIIMQEVLVLRNNQSKTNVNEVSMDREKSSSPKKGNIEKPQSEDLKTVFVGDFISIVAEEKALQEATELQ